MKRSKVYTAIDSERNYVIRLEKNDPTSHIVENFPLGSALSAIRKNLRLAEDIWYNETQPNHNNSMHIMRKIAGICVSMGEKYGMPERSEKI